MVYSSILANSRAPSPPVWGHALESTRIVAMEAPVGTVLRSGRAAQVGPAVVRGISVAVVDDQRAPIAAHVQPGEMVRSVYPAVDDDPSVALAIDCPGYVSG